MTARIDIPAFDDDGGLFAGARRQATDRDCAFGRACRRNEIYGAPAPEQPVPLAGKINRLCSELEERA